MIDNRFNALAHWDNLNGSLFDWKLDIISVDIDVEGIGETFPTIEIKPILLIIKPINVLRGIVGNNFSSYVRDYDFSVLLPEHNKHQTKFSLPENYGELHGKIFKSFLNSNLIKIISVKPPVICLGVSTTKTYHRTANQHLSWGGISAE